MNYLGNLIEENDFSILHNAPISSDVAGTELYGEQISAYVAGNTSLIRQSYITNDSNIFKAFDYNDPGFLDCSLMIAASNGITPDMFPAPVGDTIFASDNLFNYQSFFGFLYYNESSLESNRTIASRAERALDIIRETFGIQLFLLDNQIDDHFFPFVAYYPNMVHMLDIITENAPSDGYWGVIDKGRLKSQDYLQNHHLSTNVLMLDTIDLLLDGLNLTDEYFNFSLSEFGFKFLEDSISGIFSYIFDLLGLGTGDLGDFNLFDIDSSGLIPSNNKVIITQLIYEGANEGIQKIEENEDNNLYQFDLLKALNYNYTISGPLAPSDNIFSGSLLGVFLSEIDISIYSANILDFNQKQFNFSSYIFDQIETLLFFAGLSVEDTIGFIENFSFGINWDTINCISEASSTIRNFVDPLIDGLISLLFSEGLGNIPTGILDPISELSVDYSINYSLPALKIQKEFILNSFETGDYSLNITVTNNGNETAWGEELLDITSLLGEVLTGLEDLIHSIPGREDISASEYLGLNENPKFFSIDVDGEGSITYYPDIAEDLFGFLGDFLNTSGGAGLEFDLTTLSFPFSLYAPLFADDIENSSFILFTLFGNSTQRQDLADSVMDESSMFNPDNWRLDAGENLKFSVDNSLYSIYTFEKFETFNFTNNGQFYPYLYKGITSDSTTPFDALSYNSTYWNITSQSYMDEEEIHITFSFNNNSLIDLENNSIDLINFETSFISNLTGDNIFGNDEVKLEFYNNSLGEYGDFQEISFNDLSISNKTISYSEVENLDDFINVQDNYSLIFRLIFNTDEKILLSIDSVNVSFYERILDNATLKPASITYSTSTYNSYTVESNDYKVLTNDGPVLMAVASIEHQNSYPGELNNYSIEISNIGTKAAKNISIFIEIPGNIADNKTFLMNNGYLEYNISNLNNGTSEILSFEFYTPNSNYLSKAEISYDNYIDLIDNNSDFIIYSNDLLLNAPIDYESNGKRPFVDLISVNYYTNYSTAHISGGIAPVVGDLVELNISITNEGTKVIHNLEAIIPQYIKGFERIDSNLLTITELNPTETENLTIILNKTEWDAFYYQGIIITGDQYPTLRINPDTPIILGFKEISIIKTFSDIDADFNSLVVVEINVTNTGNMILKNLTVQDESGFHKSGFRLHSGVIDQDIIELGPGESFSYSYIIKMNQQGSYDISAATVDYDYLLTRTAESNTFTIKVRNNWIVNAAYILIPGTVGLLMTAILYWWKNRYDLETAEFERREELMFGTDYRATSWDKFIIEEHLQNVLDGKQISNKREKEEVF
ncbi:MAG: hypothetical protein GY870_08620 [archaeon]|nr:hypothetical protein [archaeon]